jgi:tripartite-type tricarboxylate transporter receptor subunit TctC
MMSSAKFFRQLLMLSPLVLMTGPAISDSSSASYPTKPIRLVVPYPPGGSADVLARVLGERLSTAVGQPVVVENRPGAGTAIGAKAVAQSPGDGYTLLIGTVSSHAMNPALTTNIGYDPVRDFKAIASLATIPFVLLASTKLAVNSLPDLIDLAKRQPGKLNFSSAGSGTSNHLAGEMLNSVARIQLAHIPYKGSAPALSGLLGGQVDLMFDLVVTTVPHVKAGAVRALAITAQQRSPLLPEVPTVSEAGMPALELSAWFGLFGPRDLPADVSDKLAREVGKILEMPEFQDRLRGLGASTLAMSPVQFSNFVVSERDRWAQVIKASSIKAD